MITVYVFGNAPLPVHRVTRDLRVLWALEECELPYRLHPLDFARGELKGPDYLRVQPFGQIPAIDDDGFRLFESGAIVLYLAGKAGRLLPASAADHALVQQWAFAALDTVEPAMGSLFALDAFSADEVWAKERRPVLVSQVEARLAALERELAKRPYLLGDTFGAADLLLASVLRMVEHTPLLASVPHVAAYRERCEDRPAWRKVFAEHQRRLAA